jgi:glutathione-regulated potassium-efflux system ancillary protein KefC
VTEIWSQAALWLGLALLATLGGALLAGDASWIKFLAGAGAILLTFLAGAELDPVVFRRQWKQATWIGLVSFGAPFLGCAARARWALGWDTQASWLAGIALSTTSVAVVYAVMLEFGLNATEYGKTVLAACFVTDLATVVALGIIFAPFTFRTLIFLGAGLAAFWALPWIVPRFFVRFGGRPSELEAKFLMACLFGLGALASWAGSEAVLPAYLLGMVLAGTVGKDHTLVRRLRTLVFALLTPFYFIRAGSLVSLPALVAAPAAFLVMLGGKMIAKVLGVYPVTQAYRSPRQEGIYTTLLMSTGLTFGTISALFGLSHQLISRAQYSALVAAVIGSAVIPTLIANMFFLPHHLLPAPGLDASLIAGTPIPTSQPNPASAGGTP